MEIVKVEHISKIYGTQTTKVSALCDVSFQVERGEFVAITGPSGSGKSTLLHILGGVERPSEGSVLLDGHDMYALDEDALAIFRRRQVGLIYQFYNLIPVLDVEENIMLPLLLDHREVGQERFSWLVRTLGIEDRLHHFPDQLSGGQQQRVSIARSLMASPAVVLADEPTGNLDRANSREIVALLKKLHKEQKQTLIMITHDESIALQADRILHMEDGRIVRDEVIR